ncbi:TolC family protein [Paraflavitalea soli]|uniref:TolC family protein n=1 Tax=Paraflavitalea soli TaxID=2315862 RepID=A0A3B7MLI1_9BACT|nr:TolC family protein [Paraflavitalea soli]AXY74153.1 TolC family protein [Paraflavitalea soli]
MLTVLLSGVRTSLANIFFTFLVLMAGPGIVTAQPIKLSLQETMEKVQHNLPQLEAWRQQVEAAKENGSLAKNSLVPDLTAGYQVNLATFNNITGMSYPGFLLPISGPPSVGNDMNFIPGTALGALIKWNPFTFGQRNAAIEKAAAQYKQASASYNEQLFQFQYAAINLYLESLYLKTVSRLSAAMMERYQVNLEQSLVLAKTGLKPGIDTAQFQSAIIQAEIEYLQTEKAYLQKLTELSRLTGINEGASNIVLTDSAFKPVLIAADSFSLRNHPVYQSIEAQKNTTAAGLREIQRSWVPQLDIWGNLYARGSGVDAQGAVHKADGWGLSRTNAGIGLQLSFPVLQFSKVNIRKKQYGFLLKAEEARLAQARLDIAKQIENATLQYRQDLQIAARTPVQLKIARAVYEGLQLSYEAGLIDYTRIYQSQYELTRAALNDATAQLQLWRSLLSVAVAKGNLSIFLDQLN